MIDWFVWLSPIALLPLVLLLVFVGCGLLLDLDPPDRASMPAPTTPTIDPSDISSPPPTAPVPTEIPPSPTLIRPGTLCILYGRLLLLQLHVPRGDLDAIGRAIHRVKFVEHPSLDEYDATLGRRVLATEDIYAHFIAPIDPGTYAYSCEVTCSVLGRGTDETRRSMSPPTLVHVDEWACEVRVPFEIRVDVSTGSWGILTRMYTTIPSG